MTRTARRRASATSRDPPRPAPRPDPIAILELDDRAAAPGRDVVAASAPDCAKEGA